MRQILITLAILTLAGAFAWYFTHSATTPRERYRSLTADRGDIVQTIAANGTLNPVVLVNVGTQVSGAVQKLHADFNQQVRAGQVLAELDPSLIQAAIRQAESNLASAQASLKLARTKETRTRELVERNFVARSQLDDAIETREAAQAQVQAAGAQLARERTNLRYSIIRSPISGVVVARNVDLGQTVAASFQTPTLFQIAKDLREMQIDTAIAEADIGAIRLGHPVRFSVDAFPERQFEGAVKQVRLNPTNQQNVVTYNVVVAMNNADGRLLPGMTAHVRITTQRRENALGCLMRRCASGLRKPPRLFPRAASSATCSGRGRKPGSDGVQTGRLGGAGSVTSRPGSPTAISPRWWKATKPGTISSSPTWPRRKASRAGSAYECLMMADGSLIRVDGLAKRYGTVATARAGAARYPPRHSTGRVRTIMGPSLGQIHLHEHPGLPRYSQRGPLLLQGRDASACPPTSWQPFATRASGSCSRASTC